MMAGFAFLGFLLVMAVVRPIIFLVTMYTHAPGIWLLPNLFADCGFFESFVPLWSYHQTEEEKEAAARELREARRRKAAPAAN